MACKTVCRLCSRLVISQAVTFEDGTLTINLPAGSYSNKCRYCIVIAQAIPDTATITAPVVITIGDGAVEYPLVGCNGAQLTASDVSTRTRYATVVSTDATGGVFRLLGRTCCKSNNALAAIDGTDATGGDEA